MNAYAFEAWEIPLNPPLLKGDAYVFIRISSQAKNRCRRKNQCEAFIRIVRCKLFPVPLSKLGSGILPPCLEKAFRHNIGKNSALTKSEYLKLVSDKKNPPHKSCDSILRRI